MPRRLPRLACIARAGLATAVAEAAEPPPNEPADLRLEGTEVQLRYEAQGRAAVSRGATEWIRPC